MCKTVKYSKLLNLNVEQVACVAFGALGWTGVGAALFVACEVASNYHVATSKRRCVSAYKTCK